MSLLIQIFRYSDSKPYSIGHVRKNQVHSLQNVSEIYTYIVFVKTSSKNKGFIVKLYSVILNFGILEVVIRIC